MNRKNLLVLFGGVSNEHEVSLRSAASILNHLDTDRFAPTAVGITRDGRWLLCPNGPQDFVRGNADGLLPAVLSPDRGDRGLLVFGPEGVRRQPVDIVFPAVHGQHCEDGALQGLLELTGIPYVGGGVAASAVGFDKALTHIVAERAGVPMARWTQVCAEDSPRESAARVEREIRYPCFVKPANSGSSVGCSRADDAQTLFAALTLAFREDRRAVVEELIVAQEVECAVIGNLTTEAPTTGEIVTPGGFYDYDTKYTNDDAKLFIPARIPKESALAVRRFAQMVYRAIGCRGLARVDFFVRRDGSVVFNEINTLPGFTSISMYPKMMTASQMTYSQLITRLLELALEEHTP